MAWETVEPYKPGPVKKPVRFAVQKYGRGVPRPVVTITNAVHEEIGSPARCNVFIGTGDEKGLLLIQCDADGEHLFNAVNGCAIYKITFDTILGIPKKVFHQVGVDHEIEDGPESGVKMLTLTLPDMK